MKMNVKIFILALCLSICHIAFCNVKLPLLVGDGMVLQRGDSAKIWGWADAGEKVTIDFNGKT